MDVERIQKINTLALDLMKQGLAQNREDAVIQAEHIFRSRDPGDYSNIRSTMQQVQQDSQRKTTDTPDLPPEKVREILEQNTTFLVKKIKEFQEKITTLESEVAALKIVRSAPRPAPVAETSSASATATPSRPAPASSPSSSHPRSGNYNEQDVSIEKFFYMGNK